MYNMGKFDDRDLGSEHGLLVELVRIVKVEKDGRKVGALCRWRDEVLKMAVVLLGEDDNDGDCEGNGWYRCVECAVFCGKRGC